MKLTRAQGFCDLNLPYQEHGALKSVVLVALKLGYQTIAINQHVTDTPPAWKRKRDSSFSKQDTRIIFPTPMEMEFTEGMLQRHNITRKPVILNRVTITLSDPSSAFLVKHQNAINEFDLVAVTPENEAALKHIALNPGMKIDIIALPTGPVHYPRSLLKSAVERDIYFEICYGQCLEGPTRRMETISLAHALHRSSRSANIIISSGAMRSIHLRSPYDAMNFGRFLSLSELAAKSAVSITAHNAVYCAMARRDGKAKCAVQITMLGEESENVKYEGLEDASAFSKTASDEVNKRIKMIKKKRVATVGGKVKKKSKIKREEDATVNSVVSGKVKKKKKVTKKKKATVNGIDGQVKKKKVVTKKRKATVSGIDGPVKKKKVVTKKRKATVNGIDGQVKKKKKKVAGFKSVDSEV